MDGKTAADVVRKARHFFWNIVKDFKPENGDYRPAPETMSVAQTIRHVCFTTQWFRDGAFGDGFDLNFEKFEEENRKPVTLDEALALFEKTYDEYAAFLEGLSAEELTSPMPENPILGAAPKFVVLHADADHMAHHRGALSVYLRLIGVTPTMVYSD